MPCLRPLFLALVGLCFPSLTLAQASFVNWESSQVHPLDMTPGSARLIAVNTADGRLEVFDASGPTLVPLPAIAVGVEPVSVRARTATEAWVVNHISDSVSIVDLESGSVVATLATDDEPCDVVFAGAPQRAFVSCSQANTVLVFDPANLAQAPIRLPVEAEDPRALAVSPDGQTVYCAVFESGNATTLLAGDVTFDGAYPPKVVSSPIGPHGGTNPPPNAGAVFNPPQNLANPAPPEVSLIVRRDELGQWRDDTNANWSLVVDGAAAPLSGRPVGWNLLDHDVVVIDTATLGVSYVTGLMNINMALGVRPSDGSLTVVGTDATNEIRFEPILSGTFVRVLGAQVDAATLSPAVSDLNGHLDYSTPTVPQTERDLSIGDPRAVAWKSDGSKAFIAGMGSNNLVAVDETGARVGLNPTVEVGQGPTGLALHESANRLYVLNKFDATVSIVDLSTELEVAVVPFFDPTPAAIVAGRPHLYDTHKTSGLGQISCASCHVDARTDRLAWDLGSPAGDMTPVAGQNHGAANPLLPDNPFEDFHPMKGPMLTQTLVDIIGKEPHHWRGDKNGIEDFNGAFVGLQGDDAQLSASEMQDLKDFLASLYLPPNPFRDFDNGLGGSVPLDGHYTTGRFDAAGLPLPPGDAQRGLDLFQPPTTLDGQLACNTCHSLPTGLGTDRVWDGSTYVPLPVGPNGEHHHALSNINGTVKVPHLRGLQERTGFNTTILTSTAGFGYAHDGAMDSIERFVSQQVFEMTSDQDVADVVAFLVSFSGSDLPEGSQSQLMSPPGPQAQDTHAAVGTQVTLDSQPPAASALALIDDMLLLADANAVGVVARQNAAAEERGYAYLGAGLWQSDRSSEFLATVQLTASAAADQELTVTVVPLGTQIRVGVDRDEDGHYDRDETLAASDPADPASIPGACSDPLPATPSALSATQTAIGEIELDWIASGAPAARQVIERSPAGAGNYAVRSSVPADATHFTDIGIDCGASYDYRVLAENCAGAAASAVATVVGTCDTLLVDVAELSISLGGTQAMTLRAGQEFANLPYVILGSAAGTSPGFPLGLVDVPLNLDSYFVFTVQNGNTVPLLDTIGVLDGEGEAAAQFSAPPGLLGAGAGLTLHHAFVVVDPGTLGLFMASNAVALDLLP